MGMREFDRVLKEKMTNMNLIDTVFVTGSGDNLTFGGQFKTYKMTNGIELTLKYFPLYDNTTYNRQLHPVTLKPLESYRMTFLDLGRRDGEANIVKVVRKDREFVNWCTAGSVTPAGYAHSNTEVRSNAKDGYSVHFLGEVGLLVRDPRACGELICAAE
nr:MAG TPA: major capsid protein [Caudoviricetes sp.]